MVDNNVFRGMNVVKDVDVEKREIFLRVQFANAKSSYNQLFTIITVVFGFSATFEQNVKVTENGGGCWNLYYFSPYILFTVSLGICMVGYYLLGVAGDKATNVKLWGYWLPWYDQMEFDRCAVHSSTALELSGVVFLLGLLMRAVVSLF